jgi:purine-nucleoside phosphorylase
MSAPHSNQFGQVHAAAAAVRDRFGVSEGAKCARVGVVLGSGLGNVADTVLEKGGRAVEYGSIPHFPTSSVEGHKGRLVRGNVGGVDVLLMQGRVHRYEGYSAQDVAFPIRVLHALGVEKLVVTNAAGGIGDGMKPGDLMIIDDHLNLTGDNALVGPNDSRFGPRFPDMSDAYAKRLRGIALELAQKRGVEMKHGVYAGLLGPSYETPAEIRMLRLLGASAVGMSTVHETIAANHLGLEVLGISCITNLAAGISAHKLSHDEVKATATRVEAAFSGLVLDLVPRIVA